jgi:hypothetical protein
MNDLQNNSIRVFVRSARRNERWDINDEDIENEYFSAEFYSDTCYTIKKTSNLLIIDKYAGNE